MILLVTNTQLLCFLFGCLKHGAEEGGFADVIIADKHESEDIVVL
jgi:hypothetical protein